MRNGVVYLFLKHHYANQNLSTLEPTVCKLYLVCAKAREFCFPCFPLSQDVVVLSFEDLSKSRYFKTRTLIALLGNNCYVYFRILLPTVHGRFLLQVTGQHLARGFSMFTCNSLNCLNCFSFNDMT